MSEKVLFPQSSHYFNATYQKVVMDGEPYLHMCVMHSIKLNYLFHRGLFYVRTSVNSGDWQRLETDWRGFESNQSTDGIVNANKSEHNMINAKYIRCVNIGIII